MLKHPSSSTYIHGYSSFRQDPLLVIEGEEEATSDEKEVKKIYETLGRNGCNPSSETSTGGSSASSSYSFRGHWLEEDKIFPLKKRRMIIESGADNAIAKKTEKKANATAVRRNHGKWKCLDKSDDDGDGDYEWGPSMDDSLKIRKTMVKDGSRCKRSDGRGWRCSKASVDGHSMCEDHLKQSIAANKLRAMRKHKSSKGRISGEETNHKLKTKHAIKCPFPHPDTESCFSSPKSKGSSFPIRAIKRCRRWNGRTWRCSEPPVEGHSLCEHHLTGSIKQKNKGKMFGIRLQLHEGLNL